MLRMAACVHVSLGIFCHYLKKKLNKREKERKKEKRSTAERKDSIASSLESLP